MCHHQDAQADSSLFFSLNERLLKRQVVQCTGIPGGVFFPVEHSTNM